MIKTYIRENTLPYWLIFLGYTSLYYLNANIVAFLCFNLYLNIFEDVDGFLIPSSFDFFSQSFLLMVIVITACRRLRNNIRKIEIDFEKKTITTISYSFFSQKELKYTYYIYSKEFNYTILRPGIKMKLLGIFMPTYKSLINFSDNSKDIMLTSYVGGGWKYEYIKEIEEDILKIRPNLKAKYYEFVINLFWSIPIKNPNFRKKKDK